MPPEFEKLKTMSLNRFINRSNDKYRFCYTAGCKQINFVEGPVWKCETCKVEYCNLCKVSLSLCRSRRTSESGART
jgi:hypothetical protein